MCTGSILNNKSYTLTLVSPQRFSKAAFSPLHKGQICDHWQKWWFISHDIFSLKKFLIYITKNKTKRQQKLIKDFFFFFIKERLYIGLLGNESVLIKHYFSLAGLLLMAGLPSLRNISSQLHGEKEKPKALGRGKSRLKSKLSVQNERSSLWKLNTWRTRCVCTKAVF